MQQLTFARYKADQCNRSDRLTDCNRSDQTDQVTRGPLGSGFAC
jgi:hypothetical protein